MAYKYMPLETNDFRVLHLLPGVGDDPIHCTLSQYRLAHAPRYRAVSYQWGDALTIQPISIEGRRVNVGANLASLLRHVRHHLDGVHLWVDAICINQHDIPERNEQVRRMGAIYSNAESVIIWLGDASNDSELAMRFIAEAANGGHTTSWKQEQWQAVESLLGRRFWTRIWVIQEIVLARSAWIHCGRQSVRWADFDMFMLRTSDYRGDVLAAYPDHGERRARDLWRQKRESSEQSLPDLIKRFRDFDCADARDKVYALLGISSLANDTTLQKFPINYSSSVARVFWDVMCQSGLQDLAAVNLFANALLQALKLPFAKIRCVFSDTDFLNTGYLEAPRWQTSAYAVATAIATVAQSKDCEFKQASGILSISQSVAHSFAGSPSEVVIPLIEHLHLYHHPGGIDGGGPVRIWTQAALQSIPIWESNLASHGAESVGMKPLSISLMSSYNGRSETQQGSLTLATVDMSTEENSICSEMQAGDVLCRWWPTFVDMLVRRISESQVLVGTAVYDINEKERSRLHPHRFTIQMEPHSLLDIKA